MQRSDSPSVEVSTKVALVGMLFAAYLVAFILLGPSAFGQGAYYWSSTLVSAATSLAALIAARRVEPVLRGFFGLVAVALAFEAAEMVTWERGFYLLDRSDEKPGRDTLQLYMVLSLSFHFAWACAWGFLCMQLVRKGGVSRAVSRTAVPVALLVASIFAMDYLGEGTSGVPLLKARFETLNEVLQLTGLLLGLTSVLLGVRSGYAVMNFGYVVLAASNFLIGPVTNPAGIDAADSVGASWDLGIYTIWAGILMVRRREPAASDARHPAAEAEAHSSLSALLLLFVLTAILLGMYAGVLLGEEPSVRVAAYLLIAVASVVLINRIGRRVDRAVVFAESWSRRLLENRLEAEPWTACEPSTRSMLNTTGLATVLETLSSAARWLRGEVLFLGPERIYPPVEPGEAASVRSFIVMPFSETWSAAVDAGIRDACRNVGVQPIRGDDIFTPRDILDDIWRGIHRAQFVIADITSRNPNVLYELGIAHTLAKPVLILSQSASDIPVDLSRSRVLIYSCGAEGADPAGDLTAKLAEALPAILEQYGFGDRATR